MDRCLGGNVIKGKAVVVFMYDFSRDFPVNDLLEDGFGVFRHDRFPKISHGIWADGVTQVGVLLVRSRNANSSLISQSGDELALNGDLGTGRQNTKHIRGIFTG